MAAPKRFSLEVLAVALVALVTGLILGVGAVFLFQTLNGDDPTAQARGGPGGGPPPATVRAARASEQSLRERQRAAGRLREVQRSTLASQVQGRVLEVPMEEGDPVVANETVIARIDGVWAMKDLAEAEADIAAAKAQVSKSQLDVDLLETLAASGSARPREVQEARAQLEADQADLMAAEVRRDRMRQVVERLTIYAPFDGVVVAKHTEAGQWVSPGSPVATVITSREIDAVVNVPETIIHELALGDQVDVTVESTGETHRGRVVQITPLGDNPARTFPVDIRLENVSGRLKSGMSVVGYLPVGREQSLVIVPRDAVLTRLGQSTVWAVIDRGDDLPMAMPKPVRILFGVDQDMVAVLPLPDANGDRLQADHAVVIEGAERLFATQPLVIQQLTE